MKLFVVYLAACIFLMSCTVSQSQSQSPATSTSGAAVQNDKPIDENLRYGAASIRLWDPKDPWLPTSGGSAFDGDRFHIRRINLVGLAQMAYGIGGSGEHVLNQPKWMESQAYTVEAVTEDNKLATWKQHQVMLRNLLKDRFHLVAHVETRYVSGYALVTIPGKKPNLPKVEKADGLMQLIPGDLLLSNTDMSTLANMMESIIGKPCIDKTQIAGNYKIRVKYAPMDDPNSDQPSIFVALQEQLVLKLVPEKKVPVQYLVIDSADRIPTEN